MFMLCNHKLFKMKKLLFIALFLFLPYLNAQESNVLVTTDDEKSKSILAAYDSYLVNEYDWSDKLFSPQILIYINSVKSISKEENIAGLSSHHNLFSDISMYSPGGGRPYVQTTNYNSNIGTWSHAWFIWKGTGKATGKTIEVPCHVAYQWNENGKISQTWLFSDQAPLIAEVNAASK